jgi:outer membrane protein assembly factor BamD (BamD/ComL family)
MKLYYITILSILALISCNDDKKLDLIKTKIEEVEKQNNSLFDSLEIINNTYLTPFKIYEKIVLSEVNKSPEILIKEYKRLIKRYPNSFWMHEAKNRIKNIEKRKKYWSENKGWNLPSKKEEPFIIETKNISCPGC